MMLKESISPFYYIKRGVVGVLLFGLLSNSPVKAQTVLSLNDLSSFKSPSASWHIVGDVKANLDNDNELKTNSGTGVLVNQPSNSEHGADLFTSMEHSDADIELDYMMAKGSNSGIYLQGMYEIQLLDSWDGSKTVRSADNGGIYERWDESKPEGQKGYQGYAPRQNVSFAPGLWQHLKVSFQAPRFNASGQKVENAKMLSVVLNGVVIHENVELFGPTRGAMSADEKKTGPLRIQGDHGAVAFRNIQIMAYDKPRPELKDLKYAVYKGVYNVGANYAALPPEAQGPTMVLTPNIANLPDSFLIRYTGTMHISEPGEYNFNLQTPDGAGLITINNQKLTAVNRWTPIKATLPAGDLPFEMIYYKNSDWAKPSFGLSVAGPGIRLFNLSDENIAGGEVVDPILINAPVNTVLRSFMDIQNEPRITHAISVGSPENVHYTYDLKKGMIAQVWRGGFLNATPMWYGRGDGSSRPMGAVKQFGTALYTIAQLATPQTEWITDSAGTGFRSRGYVLDESDRPTFKYNIYGADVTDMIRVENNGKGLRREIDIKNGAGNLYVLLATGKNIEEVSNNLYLLNDKSYYLYIENGGGAKPMVRDSKGGKELIIPIQSKLNYSILF